MPDSPSTHDERPDRDGIDDPEAGAGDRFETVDWSVIEAGRERSGRGAQSLLVGLGAVGVALAVDLTREGGLPYLQMRPLDWLLTGAIVVLGAAFVVPVLGRSAPALRAWERFAENRLAVVGLAYVAVFALVGLIGPALFSEPRLNVLYTAQPPVWGSIDADYVPRCYGPVVDGRCHGTWEFPLGTMGLNGKDMVPLLIMSARTSLAVVLGSAALIVPLGIAVGLVAAAAGGRIDAALMSVAEFLQTIPAILVYFLLFWWIVDGRLLLLVSVMGLVSWGGVARLVRNEAIERQRETYVRAAEVGGADDIHVVRRHILPNISSSVVTAVSLQVPLFVLIEASVSFVQIPTASTAVTMGDPSRFSWGQLIYFGLLDVGLPAAWWIAGVPLALLIGTVLSFNLVGKALTDALDPRRE